MLKYWFNTNAAEAAAMRDVSDNDFEKWANGEITSVFDDEDDDGNQIPFEKACPGTDMDPTVFGKLGEHSLNMGILHLPIPVVNVHYMYGSTPKLPGMLHMTRKDLEKVIYYASSVVAEPHESGYAYKQVLNMKETDAAREAGAETLSGAEAIEFLLNKENIPEREYIIFHSIPIMPLELRYRHVKDDVWHPNTIQMLTDRVSRRAFRYARLKALDMPEAISRNEGRVLQESCDALIDNGARGIPVSIKGYVCDSYTELAALISSVAKKKVFDCEAMRPFCEPWYGIAQEALDTISAFKKKADSEFETIDCDEYDEVHSAFVKQLAGILQPIKTYVIDTCYEGYKADYAKELDSWADTAIDKACFSWKNCDEVIFNGAEAIFMFLQTFTGKKLLLVTDGEEE